MPMLLKYKHATCKRKQQLRFPRALCLVIICKNIHLAFVHVYDPLDLGKKAICPHYNRTCSELRRETSLSLDARAQEAPAARSAAKLTRRRTHALQRTASLLYTLGFKSFFCI